MHYDDQDFWFDPFTNEAEDVYCSSSCASGQGDFYGWQSYSHLDVSGFGDVPADDTAAFDFFPSRPAMFNLNDLADADDEDFPSRTPSPQTPRSTDDWFSTTPACSAPCTRPPSPTPFSTFPSSASCDIDFREAYYLSTPLGFYNEFYDSEYQFQPSTSDIASSASSAPRFTFDDPFLFVPTPFLYDPAPSFESASSLLEPTSCHMLPDENTRPFVRLPQSDFSRFGQSNLRPEATI